MIAFGVFLLLLTIAFLSLSIIADIQDWDCGGGVLGFLAGLFFVLSMVVLADATDSKPTAMDVYQGKTTLQYTVVDSVKVDSVVVWKIKED